MVISPIIAGDASVCLGLAHPSGAHGMWQGAVPPVRDGQENGTASGPQDADP